MSTQELLTLLFDAIALSFLATALYDFSLRVVTLYRQISTNSIPAKTKANIPQLSQLPDPWMLPVDEVTEVLPPITLAQKEQIILRLLSPAKEIGIPDIEPQLEKLLLGVELNKLKLRQARKIAKELGIAQKVNGKDQRLSFLRSQIRLKLQ